MFIREYITWNISNIGRYYISIDDASRTQEV